MKSEVNKGGIVSNRSKKLAAKTREAIAKRTRESHSRSSSPSSREEIETMDLPPPRKPSSERQSRTGDLPPRTGHRFDPIAVSSDDSDKETSNEIPRAQMRFSNQRSPRQSRPELPYMPLPPRANLEEIHRRTRHTTRCFFPFVFSTSLPLDNGLHSVLLLSPVFDNFPEISRIFIYCHHFRNI